MFKKCLLSSTAFVSVAALSLLGASQKAQAAAFPGFGGINNQINFAVGLQLNGAETAADLGLSNPLSQDDHIGGDNGWIDILFYTTGTDFQQAVDITATNRVLNNTGTPNQTPTGILAGDGPFNDQVPGDLTATGTGISLGGTGAFASLTVGTQATLRSFDNAPGLVSPSTTIVPGSSGDFLPNDFTTPFAVTSDGMTRFEFTIDQISDLTSITVLPDGTLDAFFEGSGRVRAVDIATGRVLETASTLLTFASTGLRDNGTGGDPVPGDGVTNGVGIVLNITTTAIPEPTSTISLLAVGGLGLVSLARKSRKNQ